MSCWKTNCVILLVLTAVLFGSGEKVAKDYSCKKVLAQKANALSVEQMGNVSSKVRYEVCADEGGVVYYCPGDEICCTPGDPASKCCPADQPLCIYPNYCCKEGYPKICGPYCCKEEEDSFCCNEKTCCKNESACCGAQCCEAGDFCCNGISCCESVKGCCGAQCCEAGDFCCNSISCCDSVESCCGTQCCPADAPCCKQDGAAACCNKDTMGCCGDGYGCVSPCPSQFDAIGCQLSSPSLDDDLLESPYALPDNIYRILRPDENPEGIIAQDPSAHKTVLSHVNCGSRPKYASQFISTTVSLDVAKYYKEKGEEKGLTGLRICKFEADKLPTTCKIIDLTTEANRDKYLGNAVCKKFAKASAEVLLQCAKPIPCTVIDPLNGCDGKKFVDTKRKL